LRAKKLFAAVMLTVVFCTGSFTGCSGFGDGAQEELLKGDLSKNVVMTINGEKITMDTMMYYIMEQEATYSSYDTYYMATTGTSYWDMELDDKGTTVRSQLQEYIMEVAQMYEIFAQEAEKNGYELTDDMADEAEQNAASIWDNMSDKQKEVTGLTKEALVKIYQKISLATKQFDDVEAAISIDEETIAAGINKEDYQEYSIQMMCLDKKEEVDSDGTMEDVPKKELQAALKRMKKYRKELTEENDLEALIPENEKRIYVQTISFQKGDATLMEVLENAAVKLENGEATQAIETEDGYVVIEMIDNASMQAYNAAVASAVEEAQTQAFEKKFQELKDACEIEIKADIWEQVTIGKLTVDETEEGSVELPEETAE